MNLENGKIIRVGSRSSKLALVQVNEIEGLLKKQGGWVSFDRVTYKTEGDIDKLTPLTGYVADNFFTNTLDEAVICGEIDVAVHSAKDLPKQLDPQLEIYALTKSIDETDCFVGKKDFYSLSQGARVGTSSLLRQESIRMLNPHVSAVDVRGTIEERIAFVDEGKVDGVIVATVALKRLGLEKRITNIMPWPATALQGQLAVVGLKDNYALRKIFSGIDVRKTYGTVTLVGAGPGDPELITVKGINALERADCVFYDYLLSEKLLDYCPSAEKIYVGKRKGVHSLSQEELCHQIRIKAQQGKNIVRLKGGDPLIFGRGADEIEFLHGYFINVAIIPGVSSATGIPSSLGLPLTARGLSSSVAFISGHSEKENESAPKEIKIPDADTLVFLMGITKLDTIVDALHTRKWAKDTPVIIISKGTYPDEEIIDGTLQDISDKFRNTELQQPAIIIVGKTVRFWVDHFKNKKAVLYTGTNPQEYAGMGRIIHLPMIQIEKAKKTKHEVDAVIKNLNDYQVIMFTSRFAVACFFEILADNGYGKECVGKKTFFVIGSVTQKALRGYGFTAAVVADTPTSEGLFETVSKNYNVKGKKILFPRSALPNPTLKKCLTSLGADVCEWVVYENIKPPKRDLPEADIDKVVFTSPSTVRNFLEDYKQIPKKWHIISKGPLTMKSLEDAGYKSEGLVL